MRVCIFVSVLYACLRIHVGVFVYLCLCV